MTWGYNLSALRNRATKLTKPNAHKNKYKSLVFFVRPHSTFLCFCGIVWYLTSSATPYAARGSSWYHIQCIRAYSVNRESGVHRHSTLQRGIKRENEDRKGRKKKKKNHQTNKLALQIIDRRKIRTRAHRCTPGVYPAGGYLHV
jgi:hypothetical protein